MEQTTGNLLLTKKNALLTHSRVPAACALDHPRKNVDTFAEVPPRALARHALKGTSVLLGLSSPQTNIPRRSAERAVAAEEGASAPGRHRNLFLHILADVLRNPRANPAKSALRWWRESSHNLNPAVVCPTLPPRPRGSSSNICIPILYNSSQCPASGGSAALSCVHLSVVHAESTPEVSRNGPLGVPSILGVGINDGLRTPHEHLETQECRAVQLIHHCSIEKKVCDFSLLMEGSTLVAQPLLVLPLLQPVSRMATIFARSTSYISRSTAGGSSKSSVSCP